MTKRFINSMLQNEYQKILDNSIQIHKIEKEPYHKNKWFSFRISYLDPTESCLYVYISNEHCESDVKLLQQLLKEQDE